MSTPPMFDMPTAGELAKPSEVPHGSGKIVYSAYAPKNAVNCDDCLRCSLEANLAGRGYPSARKARVRRTQGRQVDLLCHGHRDMRKADEAREQVEAELRAVGAT